VASVAFLRAVNLGGKTLRTTGLAEVLGLVNVGAAGTFVALDGRSRSELEGAIRARLPFQTEVLTCTGPELLALLEEAPFGRGPAPDAQRFATLLARAPSPLRLPLEQPEGRDWEVRIVAVAGRWVLSLRRPGGARALYPNAVVERAFGAAATTRGWATLAAVGLVLQGGAVTGRGAPPAGRAGR
jgi:uncharacterized protein (DUF1697 family)